MFKAWLQEYYGFICSPCVSLNTYIKSRKWDYDNSSSLPSLAPAIFCSLRTCTQSYYRSALVCYCHNLLKCWRSLICLSPPITLLWWAWLIWWFLQKIQLVCFILFIGWFSACARKVYLPRIIKALKQNLNFLLTYQMQNTLPAPEHHFA